MKRIPRVPDEHLIVDIQILEEEHSRIFGWDQEELVRRQHAWFAMHARAANDGAFWLTPVTSSRAVLWGAVLLEYGAHGLQSSIDLATEMLQDVRHG